MKKKTLNKTQLVKQMSRERLGPVPPVRRVPNKRRALIEKARKQDATLS